jgi:hypothetical protein
MESLGVVDIHAQVGDVGLGVNRNSRAGLRANYDPAAGGVT